MQATGASRIARILPQGATLLAAIFPAFVRADSKRRASRDVSLDVGCDEAVTASTQNVLRTRSERARYTSQRA